MGGNPWSSAWTHGCRRGLMLLATMGNKRPRVVASSNTDLSPVATCEDGAGLPKRFELGYWQCRWSSSLANDFVVCVNYWDCGKWKQQHKRTLIWWCFSSIWSWAPGETLGLTLVGHTWQCRCFCIITFLKALLRVCSDLIFWVKIHDQTFGGWIR